MRWLSCPPIGVIILFVYFMYFIVTLRVDCSTYLCVVLLIGVLLHICAFTLVVGHLFGWLVVCLIGLTGCHIYRFVVWLVC